jgi:hypothetical protein
MAGVIEATWDGFKSHPWLIVGGVGAVALLIWYTSRGSGTAAPQNFAFSYGPSDSQVAAGTALQIAQAGDQAALANATIQAGTATTVAGDYYNYLSNNSSNTLQSVIDTNNANIAINSANDTTQEYENELQASNTGTAINYAGTQIAQGHAVNLTVTPQGGVTFG